jgi:hypothetical protein
MSEEDLLSNITELTYQVSNALVAVNNIQSEAVRLNSLLRDAISERNQYPTAQLFLLVLHLDQFLMKFSGFSAFGNVEELRPVCPPA